MARADINWEELEDIHAEATEDLAREWHSAADKMLLTRGDDHEYEVYPVVQGSIWGGWDEQEGGWSFFYPHIAAPIFEFGSDPHKIEPRDEDGWLAFEWPEMEGEEFGNTGMTFDEVFEDSWPTVFFKEVLHPGTAPIRFVSDSARKVT